MGEGSLRIGDDNETIVQLFSLGDLTIAPVEFVFAFEVGGYTRGRGQQPLISMPTPSSNLSSPTPLCPAHTRGCR